MSKLLAALRQIDAKPIPVVAPAESTGGGITESVDRTVADRPQIEEIHSPATPPAASAATLETAPPTGEGALRTVAELNHLLEEALAAQQIDLANEQIEQLEIDDLHESPPVAHDSRDHHETLAVSREYAELAERLLAALNTPLPAVAMFATAQTDNADSFWLLPLAVACARNHAGRVLIVEAAGDAPRWATYLGIEVDSEMVGAHDEHEAWRNSIRRTAVPRIDLLPRGMDRWSNDAEANEQLESLLIGAKAEYQVILVAAGNAERPAAADLARHCDGVVLVVGLHSTARAAAQRAKQSLESAGARVVGAIVRG